MIPKVYRFVLMNKEGQLNTPWIVARNENNAFKRIAELSNGIDFDINQYTVMEESWLANLLILFLPRYTYKGSEWAKWRKPDANL